MRLPPIEKILALSDIALLDAIAREMWGRPPQVKPGGFGGARNHNANLARLAGVSERRIRQYREEGKVDANRLAVIVDRWKLWRAEQKEKAA